MSFPIIAGVVGAATSAMGGIMDDAASKQAHAAQTEMSRRSVEAARESALDDFAALGRQERELAAQTAQEIEFLSRDARAALGQERVGQAAAGVSGNTAEALLQDYERAAEEAATATLLNERMAREDLKTKGKAVSANLRAAEINATVAPRRRTNYFTAALNAGTTGLSTYSLAGGQFAEPDKGLP